MAMEIGHALGLVPPGRGRTGDPAHSPFTAADAGSNRGYNLRDRSFLADDRTARYFSGPGFTNTSTLLEQLDYAFLLCALGGSTPADCSNSQVIGGTAAGARRVTGTVAPNGLSADVVESYSASVEPRPRRHRASVLRQFDGNPRPPTTRSYASHSGASTTATGTIRPASSTLPSHSIPARPSSGSSPHRWWRDDGAGVVGPHDRSTGVHEYPDRPRWRHQLQRQRPRRRIEDCLAGRGLGRLDGHTRRRPVTDVRRAGRQRRCCDRVR